MPIASALPEPVLLLLLLLLPAAFPPLAAPEESTISILTSSTVEEVTTTLAEFAALKDFGVDVDLGLGPGISRYPPRSADRRASW